MLRSEQSRPARAERQYVTLGIDGEVFAVDVEGVREILDMRPVARVPHAPPFMIGMIDVRGHGAPVIDLRVKLGLPTAAATEHTRIIVLDLELEGRARLVGLVADRVFEVTSLAEHSLDSPPEVGMRWRSDYIETIARRDGRFVIVFDMARLFTADEAASVAATGAQP